MHTRAAGPRLAVTALVTGALLAWAPGTLANAYPDAPTPTPPPLCEDVAPAVVAIDGGTVTNTTTLDLSADGGTGIGDSSGGDDNLATTGGDKDKDNDNDNKGKKGDNRKDRRDRDDRDKDDGETSAAGNGGRSDAGADGGAIAVEDVNSGGNVGSAIAVGDTIGTGGGYGCYPADGSYSGTATGSAGGGVFIDGGTVTNETIIEVSADGGTAIADASGGDHNVASNGGSAGNGGSITSSAGNGGVSTASADGGVISLGNINSGGNAGNAISVGDTIAGPGPIPIAPPRYEPVPIYPAPSPGKTHPGTVVVVTELPSTGEGMPMAGQSAAAAALLALCAGITSLSLRMRRPLV